MTGIPTLFFKTHSVKKLKAIGNNLLGLFAMYNFILETMMRLFFVPSRGLKK